MPRLRAHLALSSLVLATIGCVPPDPSTPTDGPRAERAPADLALAPNCVGLRPPEAAWSASPSPWRALDGGVVTPPDGGAGQLPSWALLDFQPRSCGYRATYGTDLYRGKAVLLALWAGW